MSLVTPLAVSLVWMLRYAGPIRPVPVAALGGLAGAALSVLRAPQALTQA